MVFIWDSRITNIFNKNRVFMNLISSKILTFNKVLYILNIREI